MALPSLIDECLCFTIKGPLLTHLVLSPSLENDIVGSNTFSDSLHWKSRSDVEWSSDVESEVFIHSFSWFFVLLVNVDNSPSLVDTTIVAMNLDGLTLNIFVT